MALAQRKTILRGIHPSDLGTHSKLSFFHAIEFTYRRCPVFPSHGENWTQGNLEAATTDQQELRRHFDEMPESDYRGRSEKGDALWAFRVKRARNVAIIQRDTGMDLPATQVIELPDGSDSIYLFAQKTNDPEYALGSVWQGTDIGLVRSFAVPGSLHRTSGQRWQWRHDHGPDAPLAHLPEKWLNYLPLRDTNAISATRKSRREVLASPDIVFDRRRRKRPYANF